MLNFKIKSGYIETDLTGKSLMTTTQLNKGTAFSAQERKLFCLEGKLPACIESLTRQVERAYLQFSSYQHEFQKHIYLNDLHDKNQVLFYKLVSTHLTEMAPLIYTPWIGKAVEEYSHEFRQARGLYLSYEDKDQLDQILDNRSNPEIDLIVVTDGQGVLGIGDQGVGSINIPIGKLMIYTLLGKISPFRTLPICLDLGTDNALLLNDRFYLGRRYPRLDQNKYDDFIAAFVKAVQRKFPLVFLHWEDFGKTNARKILARYRQTLCTFNDDVQGTGVVALSALLAAIKKSEVSIDDHRIMIFGAGTAGTGIADQIYRALLKQGLSEQTARSKFWLIDKNGLITAMSCDLTPPQSAYARFEDAYPQPLDFFNAVLNIKPTVLIGCSAQQGAFQENIIKAMASFVKYPIIFPLSNPLECAEAVPEDLIKWTQGRALIAAGSPFAPVNYKGKVYPIAQCNNALAFPGIGLGILAVRAKSVTDEMLFAASEALSGFSRENSLLPSIEQSSEAAFAIAKAVARKAVSQGLARIETKFFNRDVDRNKEDKKNKKDKEDKEIEMLIRKILWEPEYLPLKKRL